MYTCVYGVNDLLSQRGACSQMFTVVVQRRCFFVPLMMIMALYFYISMRINDYLQFKSLCFVVTGKRTPHLLLGVN